MFHILGAFVLIIAIAVILDLASGNKIDKDVILLTKIILGVVIFISVFVTLVFKYSVMPMVEAQKNQHTVQVKK